MSLTNQTHGLWEKTAISAPSTTRLQSHLQADVAVIGGGITGLSTALHLAEQGARVIVLEAHQFGYGGSGRNAGLVNPGMWVQPDVVCAELGEEAGERLLGVLGEAPSLVFDLISRHGIDCEAVRNGTLQCAIGRSGLREIQQREEQWRRRGAAVRLLDAAETAKRTGSTQFVGALLDERAGTIQPLSYVRGLARAAINKGARLFSESRVLDMTRKLGSWEIRTETGTVLADWVVASTNAYSDSLLSSLKREIIPLYYFQFATSPLANDVRQRVLTNREGFICTRSVVTSLRADAAGRLIFGSVGALRNIGAAVHRAYARRSLERMFPMLRDVKFENEWFGTIAATTNSLPRYHELDHQVISFHGYNGRGIGTGTVFGRIMANRILDPKQDMPLAATDPESPLLRGVRSGYYEAGSVLAHLL